MDYKPYPIGHKIRQSPPIDVDAPFDRSWLKGRTILITGGASGFGAAFAREWAAHGATIVVGDISIATADALVRDIRSTTGNENVHFVQCDVTNWQSQVNCFKEAVKLSGHGGIDAVVANAGIAGVDEFETPQKLDAAEPPKPDLKTYDVNLTGVLYTTHLAFFYLPRNPGSSRELSSERAPEMRDRHLLLVGSMASLGPIPAQPLYAVSKHGVMGLFRTLRSTSFVQGIRVNIICPYFIDTPILPAGARGLLAGGAMGKPEDVVEAATRLTADSRIIGRSLYIGPKMKVVADKAGDWQLALTPNEGRTARERAVWEAYAHDYDDSELFGRNLIRLLNRFAALRGWAGYIVDMWRAVKYGLGFGARRASNKKT